MALTINTEMTDLGMKFGYYAERPLAVVILAHAEATQCVADAQDMLATGDGEVLDLDAMRCALLMQRVAASELVIRGCTVGYGAEGQALVTEPEGGVFPRTATIQRQAPKALFRVYLYGMAATDVVVEAESEAQAERIAYRMADAEGFDWNGAVEVDPTSTSLEEVTLAELSDDERARLVSASEAERTGMVR